MLTFFLFLGIFATIALLLMMLTAGNATETKQTLSRLEAIGSGPMHPDANPETADSIRRNTGTSLHWLDKLLARFELGPKLTLLLYQAELNWSVARLLGLSLLSGFICSFLVYMRTEAVPITMFFAVLGASIPFLYVWKKRERRFYRMKELLPAALDLMVAAIRAGHSFTSAIGMASKESQEPIRREFRQCFDEQNFGLDLRVAMLNLVWRAPIRDIRMMTTAVLIQKETGGNLTEILEKTGHLIREDFRLQRQVMVHTAQGRLTGWILSILPVVLGILLYFVNPEQLSLLWRHPAGIRMLEAASVMTFIGVMVIRKIVRIEI
jgi:tight adherence protein B